MGAIWVTRARLQGAVSELAGLRSGLALTSLEIDRKVEVDAGSAAYWFGDLDDTIRIRSEEYENLLCALLASLGAVPADALLPPCMYILHRFRGDPERCRLALAILELWTGSAQDEIEPVGDPFAPPDELEARALRTSLSVAQLRAVSSSRRSRAELIALAKAEFGELGLELGALVVERLRLHYLACPWAAFTECPWPDSLPLSDLFNSEDVSPSRGRFIDQRFINYLSANYEDVDRIHWRKFEALAAEYFHREGCAVEIGPGRNDDGVDLRVWEKGVGPEHAPLILVQCKRQKEAVGKVVVKSLCLDVQHEGAAKGLIVTTSRVTPGVKAHWSVRRYQMEFIEREQVQSWISGMRMPATGPFQAE